MTAQAPYHRGNLRAQLLQRAAEVIDQQGIEALSLRALARELGVSHGAPNRHFKTKGALLAALMTDGWLNLRNAVLRAAEACQSDDAHKRLNAMGRGYLRWAFDNPSVFRTLHHPDVSRFADDELIQANNQLSETIREAVAATQSEGRHSTVPLPVLTLYTVAVPTGAALNLIGPFLQQDHPDLADMDQEALITQLIELVVPINSP